MSFDWNAPVYDDIDREARSDWLRERPDEPPNHDEPSEFEHNFSPQQWRAERGIPEPVIPDFSKDTP